MKGLGLVKLPEHTHSLRHTLPNALTSVAVSSQSTQSWTQLPSLSLLTNLYNNASSAKSCNSLTQASYHRERVVDVNVNTRRTLTTYPQTGLTAAQANGPLQEPPLLANEGTPLRSHHCHVPKRSHGHRQLAASPNCSTKSRLPFHQLHQNLWQT